VSATLTAHGKICQIISGNPLQSHQEAMLKSREQRQVNVAEPMDIVVTSAGGRPFDSSLASVVQTLCSVEPVLKADGTIIIAAELGEGFGSKDFADILTNHQSVADTIERFSKHGFFNPAQ